LGLSSKAVYRGMLNNNGAPAAWLDGYQCAHREVARALTAAEIAAEFVLMEADVA